MTKLPPIACFLALAAFNGTLLHAGEGYADAVSCSTLLDHCPGDCAVRCGCGLLGRLRGCRGTDIEGLDRHFNCGCRGSYNYPVPPLYTYHWPGMYKQNLMTDYVSPWRFPPLRPYVDELPVHSAEAMMPPALRPVSATAAMTAVSSDDGREGHLESISSRLMRRP